MTTLILMRHAKSAWDEPGLSDHDRPLNARGRASAPVMAAWLAEQRLLPDLVLCSSATRTRETVDLMPGLPAPVIDPRLYLADPATILGVLAPVQGAARVMVVAHQPGLGDLAQHLAPGAIAAFPTAAVAVFDLNGDAWDRIAPGGVTLQGFATPRALMR